MATETFNSSSTWTVPANLVGNVVTVECYGAGAGGGRFNAAGGGGGGAYSSSVIAVTPGNVETISVGAGGAGGAVSSNGSDGGDTFFRSTATVLAKGGSGGQQVSGGQGGQASSGVGTTKRSGGNGGSGANVLPGAGGGGGGSGSSSSNGSNGGDGSGVTSGAGGAGAGSGGAGGDGSASIGGSAGTAPGGGGGGNGNNGFIAGVGGAGAAGRIVLTWEVRPEPEIRGSWTIHEGIVERWTDAGMDAAVKALGQWASLSTSEKARFQALNDTESRPKTPFPYVVYQVGEFPVRVFGDSGGHDTEHGICWSYRVTFTVHAKTKQLARQLAKSIAGQFLDKMLCVSPDEWIATNDAGDFSFREGDENWAWRLMYDVVVMANYLTNRG